MKKETKYFSLYKATQYKTQVTEPILDMVQIWYT